VSTVTIPTTGQEFTVAWRSVAGATGVEVAAAQLVLHAAPAGSVRRAPTVAGAASDVNAIEVTLPGGERTVRSLTLNGFTRPGEAEPIQIRDAGDLDGRLSVAVVDAGSGQAGAPVHVVPAIPRRGEVPQQLGGASFHGRVLALPDLRAAKLQVTRVHNEFPEDFDRQLFSVASIDAALAPYPEALTVAGPDGATLFSRPGPLGPAVSPVVVDLRVPLELVLTAAVQAGTELTATFTVRADVEGDVRTDGIAAAGAVVRAVTESIAVDLTGLPRPLVLGGAGLDRRAPVAVTADVTITYGGLRLHELSATVPSGAGGIGGPVVGADPVLVRFPPQALAGERIARIGLVGRPVGDTDLSVRLVRTAGGAVGGAAGEPFGAPGVLSIPPDVALGSPSVAWVALPEPVEIVPPAGVTVSATRGAFRWVADPEPLVLLAVVDADPGGRPIRIGSTDLAVTQAKQTHTGFALAPDTFAGAAPVVSSALFAAVHFAHLTLRYAP
jgi:hypothetical protein